MHTERLKGHSCVHCEGIVLPGNQEEIQQDDRNPWDAPPSTMHFSNKKVNSLGISLADLETKSTGDCKFALYLRQRIEESIQKSRKSRKGYEQPDPEAVKLFVSVTEHRPGVHPRFAFYTLVHLGTIYDPLTFTVEVDFTRCYVHIGNPDISFELTGDEGKAH